MQTAVPLQTASRMGKKNGENPLQLQIKYPKDPDMNSLDGQKTAMRRLRTGSRAVCIPPIVMLHFMQYGSRMRQEAIPGTMGISLAASLETTAISLETPIRLKILGNLRQEAAKQRRPYRRQRAVTRSHTAQNRFP